MDIREAIQHCREVAAGATAQGKCPECAAEHEQLAEWLEELAAYKDTGLTQDILDEFAPFLLEMQKSLGAMRYLKELLQAQMAGWLVVLPCKVGDMVYFPVESRWDSATIDHIEVYADFGGSKEI